MIDGKVKSRLMAHIVAGYPDMERSFEAARGLIDGGAAYLEVQFPFSDPSADGVAIQKACSEALAGGFTTGKGF
ncbi:MAG: tryptophan synthase subunit alpha, partial [Spirochaetota bacterium]